MQFGLAAGAAHVVEWARHLTRTAPCVAPVRRTCNGWRWQAAYATAPGCADYYCFINEARRDLGVDNITLSGSGVLNAFRWGDRLSRLASLMKQ